MRPTERKVVGRDGYRCACCNDHPTECDCRFRQPYPPGRPYCWIHNKELNLSD